MSRSCCTGYWPPLGGQRRDPARPQRQGPLQNLPRWRIGCAPLAIRDNGKVQSPKPQT